MLDAYADAAPDLIRLLDNTTRISQTIVDQQDNLGATLLGVIRLAERGNDVLGSNRQPLTDLLRLLTPSTELLNRYHVSLNCALAGMLPFVHTAPSPVPGLVGMGSLVLGKERYRYPQDLPKVAAKGGPHCADFGMPDIGPATLPPYLIADVGTSTARYGNQSILLNSDGLKQMLYGPIDGPPRNTETGRAAGMSAVRGPAIKFSGFFIVMTLFTGVLFMVFSQQGTRDTNTYSAVFANVSDLRAGDSVRVAGIRIGTVSRVELKPDKNVVVTFDADRTTVLTSGTKAVVRFLNLVGDRYLELVNEAGSTRIVLRVHRFRLTAPRRRWILICSWVA